MSEVKPTSMAFCLMTNRIRYDTENITFRNKTALANQRNVDPTHSTPPNPFHCTISAPILLWGHHGLWTKAARKSIKTLRAALRECTLSSTGQHESSRKLQRTTEHQTQGTPEEAETFLQWWRLKEDSEELARSGKEDQEPEAEPS